MWLGINWIGLIEGLAIVTVTTFVITFVWAYASRKLAHLNKPYRSDALAATIRPWPPFWWFTTLFLGFVTLAGGASGFFSGGNGVALTMVILSAGLGVLVWMSLLMCLPRAHVTWTERGVEGPANAFSFGRSEMNWESIERVHRSEAGNYFMDHRGQRIVWSDTYVGSAYLWGYLLQKRPDLKPSVIQPANV
ncbi:MAG TPA: hypothetical protein VG841_00180 [Caulobacterales bacterium]|nr:hypothetical protein [Caulobacterales bacterium]